MFDYHNCSLEQMIEHIKNCPTGQISRMRQYHKKRGNKEVVKKIDMARECVKLEKVQQRMSDLQND